MYLKKCDKNKALGTQQFLMVKTVQDKIKLHIPCWEHNFLPNSPGLEFCLSEKRGKLAH